MSRSRLELTTSRSSACRALTSEIIEPHDGTDVTAQGGLFPHIAIEVNDIDAAIADLKAAGITNFRGGVDKAADLPIFGGIRNAFFIGPNGEQLELLQHL